MVSVSPILSALHSSNDNSNNNNNNSNNNHNSNNASSDYLNGNITGNGTNYHSFRAVVHMIQPEEFAVLGIIVCMWIVAVFAFLKKWASIRILQPIEPRYRHSPKNLENVRVVKRAQDSVIYKNYSRKMSVTMVARENRRLQRMHTVPIMGSLPPIAMETNTTEI